MLMGLTQALRLWNRAVDILIRLTEKAQPVAPAEPANPFEVQDAKPTTLDEMSQAKKTVSRGAIMDGIQWQIAQVCGRISESHVPFSRNLTGLVENYI